ncbi:MAG: hypothetical protein ACOYEV_12475, partial [Candidatus Nanopelagicales bacterium]
PMKGRPLRGGRAAVVCGTGALILAQAPAAAGAAETPLGTARTTITSFLPDSDPLCLAVRRVDGSQGPCATATATTATAATPVTAGKIPTADQSLQAADGTTLKTAAAASSIWTYTWSQEQRGV